MANLLDEASILLTATAYDNGSMLAVKPENGDGDFTFSRNSAATRVNAQGLVENVQILSSNLVSNGDFSQEGVQEVSNGSFSQEGANIITPIANSDFSSDTGYWTKETGVTISGGLMNMSSTPNNQGFYKGGIIEVGKNYKVEVTISGYSEGLLDSSNSNSFSFPQSNGTYVVYFTGANPSLSFAANGTTTLSIDNVSVKEVGQDWTLGSGWSIGEDKAINDGNGGGIFPTPNSLTSGATVKFQVTISDRTNGYIRIQNPSSTIYYVNNINTNGTFEYSFTTIDANGWRIEAVGGFNGSITNISVKEVGQNWNLGTGFSIGENVAIYDDSANGNLSQNKTFTSNKKYNISFEIKSGSGSIAFLSSNGVTTYVGYATYGIGTHSVVFDYTTGSGFGVFASSFLGGAFSITNITLKEITDDTNLPRINYEGFSYQDSLGSELVTNGDFATGSDWSKGSGVTISGGEALITVTNGGYQFLGQSVTYISGKSYTLTASVNGTIGKGCTFFDASGNNGGLNTSNGIVTFNGEKQYISFDFIANSNSNTVLITRNGTGDYSFSIDNVSVKEVTQEVVPNSGCGSWLLEPQSSNLIPYSSDFSQSAWVKSGSSVESGYLSPSGETNASKFTAINTDPYLLYAISGVTNLTYSASLYIKGTTSTIGETARLWIIRDNVVFHSEDFTITDIWQRISTTKTFTSTPTSFVSLRVDLPNTNVSIGDETYMWGAQLEAQSFPTSYIPTSGATSTRLQDIANNSGNASLINSESGVLYTEIKGFENDLNYRTISLTNTTGSNRVNIWIWNDGRLRVDLYSESVEQFGLFLTYDMTTSNKIAVKYKLNDFSVWLNGVKVYISSIGAVPIGLSKVDFSNGLLYPFYGKTKALAVFKTALTDANLRSLTYPPAVATTFDLNFNTIAEQFTFTRGSEATFVNAQGLIQSTNEIGAELVTNGDFSNGLNNWSVVGGSYASVNNGILNSNNTSNGSWHSQYIAQGISFINGKTYAVKFKARNINGSTNLRLTQQAFVVFSNNITSEFVDYTVYYTAQHDGYELRMFCNDSVGQFEIDNVSVKEYITATNTPRLDYSTGSEAFLLEPQSTNLIRYSEDFSNSYWLKLNNVNVSNEKVISPDGTLNASQLIYDGTSGGRIEKGIGGLTQGADYTVSVYARVSSGTQAVRLGSVNDFEYTLTTEWQRLTSTQPENDTVAYPRLICNDTATIEIWAFQLEQQSFATSYIPTSGATATRNQELCNNATPVINSEEGTLYAEIGSLIGDESVGQLSLSNGTANETIKILYLNSNSVRVEMQTVSGVNFVKDITLTRDGTFDKVAIRYKSNNYAVYHNGVSQTVTQTASTPIGLNKIAFNRGDGGSIFFGNTKGLKVYPKALADVQLQDLTTI